MRAAILAPAVFLLLAAAFGQSSSQAAQHGQTGQDSMATCPMHDSYAAMNKRGAEAMGFSQTETTHHFLLTANGGAIQVEANRAADTTNRNAIRMHLTHITKMFSEGDFDIPMFVHDTVVPPGVPEMKRLRKDIQYSFEETPNGGRVVISSANKEAVEAIHCFLRLQIEEHKTGDPMDVR
jgi:hypothetical protein